MNLSLRAFSTWLVLGVALGPARLVAQGSPAGIELEGYSEPYRTVKLATDETGVIGELLVREGDPVSAGQPLARLNSDVFLAMLAIAEQNMRAEGRLDAIRAELALRQERLAKLRQLQASGHARPEEVDRASAEVAVSEGNQRAAREELLSRKLEYQRVQTQIERRTVRSPINGFVVKLHKEAGELVAPNSAEILTLVQLDSLLVHFTMTSIEAAKYKKGQVVKLRFLVNGAVTEGVVEFIAPVTDAESGMVRMKVRVDNRAGRLRSGERCKLIGTAPPPT